MAIDPKQIVDKLLKLKPAHKVLLLVAINAALGAAFYFTLIAATMDEIKLKKASLKKLNAELTEKLEIAANIPKFQREKEELEAKLKLALTKMPTTKDVPGLYSNIRTAADTVEMHVKSLKVAAEIRKGFYSAVPVRAVLEGTYQSFLNFCDKVSRFDRIVNIDSISVKSKKLSNDPTLNITFTLTAFRFLPDKIEK